MQKCRFLKSRRAGREIMQRLVRSRCEASTSSLYSNVICLTQIGRCTRCWIWRQLSDPTGLRGLSCSSWWKCVQTTGLSPVRHVSQGFSFICKHCAVEKKKCSNFSGVAAQWNGTGSFCALTAEKQLYRNKIWTRAVGFLRLNQWDRKKREIQEGGHSVTGWRVLVRRP